MNTLFPGMVKETKEDPLFDKWFEKEKSDATDSTERCARCKSEDIQHDEISVCKACGEMIETPLDMGAEFRFFGSEDRSSNDPCRVGAPTDTRFPSSTLGTMILMKSTGGTVSNRIAMARVRRYHTWNLLPYRERALLQVFEQLSLAATNYGMDGRTIDKAKELYIRLVEHCDRRGMSRTSVVASCIYSALKMVGQPRKPLEIAEMFHLSSTQFTKSFKYFQEVLSMANQRGLLGEAAVPASLSSTRASDYVSHPLSRLPVSRVAFLKIQSTAKEIANLAEEKELCPENMPPSLAAGVLAYILPRAGHPEITNERIASVCGVSEGTLVKCLRKLEAAADMLKGFLEEKPTPK
jgi:transcription initiation factor TFIIIB Brf1 subunit/transcription initiation factor TFIIB